MAKEYSIQPNVESKGYMRISKNEIMGEARLIEKVKKDIGHFKALYEKYFKDIYAFIFYRLRDKDEASDITSQVFLKALLKIRTYKFKNVPFSAWLYKIAINEVNLYYRKNKRSKVVIIDDMALAQISSEVEDENLAYRKEKLENILQTLSKKEIQLVELRFQLKMSYKEIACVIDSSEINARVKLHRLVNKIKNKWG